MSPILGQNFDQNELIFLIFFFKLQLILTQFGETLKGSLIYQEADFAIASHIHMDFCILTILFWLKVLLSYKNNIALVSLWEE